MMCELDYVLLSSSSKINYPLKPVPIIYLLRPRLGAAWALLVATETVTLICSLAAACTISPRISQVKLSKRNGVSLALVADVSRLLFFFKVIYKVLDPAIHVKDPYSLDIQGQEMLTRLIENLV